MKTLAFALLTSTWLVCWVLCDINQVPIKEKHADVAGGILIFLFGATCYLAAFSP